MSKRCLNCGANLTKNQIQCEYCAFKLVKAPKTNIYLPAKTYGSKPIKHFIGFIACLIGSLLAFSSPFQFWHLLYLIISYRGYEYLDRQSKGSFGLLFSIIGIILAFLTY